MQMFSVKNIFFFNEIYENEGRIDVNSLIELAVSDLSACSMVMHCGDVAVMVMMLSDCEPMR